MVCLAEPMQDQLTIQRNLLPNHTCSNRYAQTGACVAGFTVTGFTRRTFMFAIQFIGNIEYNFEARESIFKRMGMGLYNYFNY